MANTEFSLRDINTNLLSQHPAIVRLPKITAPYTTIVNRAQVTDFSNDLLPRMGVDRFMIQQIIEVQGEFGPNGERVFKAINDNHEAVRLYGAWSNLNDASGQRPQSATPGGSIEIVFYGTGVNMLRYNDSGNRSFTWSLNGGAQTGSVTGAQSDVLITRNYNMNTVTPVVSNLTLGVHTIVITSSNNVLPIFGYEVINSSSSLQLVPGQLLLGSTRLNKSSLSTTAYNSGFESGTLGTRGGHVLIYQKSDGTIAKAVTPVDAAPKGLGFSGTNANGTWAGVQADHTNEEITRIIHWREFGAGRTDDFSSVSTTQVNRAFTLDDGTTSLVGAFSRVVDNEFIGTQTSLTITFVGTGLDFVRKDSATLNPHSAFIDGVSIGSLNFNGATGDTNIRIQKICSGLPYGTHTFRLNCDTFFGNNFIQASQFIIYGPKTPTLPTGAVALADYFVMADFAANTTAGAMTTATGILRKHSTREFIYSGTWTAFAPSAGLASDELGGWEVASSTTNDYLQYTFWGTGFEHRFSVNATSSTWQYTVDGSTNLSSFSTSTYGTFTSFTAGTGTLVTAAGSVVAGGVRVSGLSLGLHTVRITKTAGTGTLYHTALDVATPIHTIKEIGPTRLQNVSLIGSSGVRDLRNFGEQQVKEQKAISQVVGVTSSPTSNSTSAIPFPDMSAVIKTSGNPILVNYSVQVRCDTVGAGMTMAIRVNGIAVAAKTLNAPVANYVTVIADSFVVPAAAGTHKIDVYWSTSAGTMLAFSTDRNLYAREL